MPPQADREPAGRHVSGIVRSSDTSASPVRDVTTYPYVLPYVSTVCSCTSRFIFAVAPAAATRMRRVPAAAAAAARSRRWRSRPSCSKPKPIPQSSEFVATIRSLRSTTVQPQVEGIVRQIFVRAGDRVGAGQPLIQIDPDKQQATNTVTESQRASREADLAFAKQQLARMQKLFEAGAVSRAELEQAETAHKNAEAQLAAVQSQIRENQVELQYYRVTAPSAGVVGEVAIRQGDRVTPSTVITTIDQPEGLEAYINVPLERAMDLKTGPHRGAARRRRRSDRRRIRSPSSRRAPTMRRSRCWSRRRCGRCRRRFACMQYVRARIIWSNEPTLAVPIVAVSRLAGQHFVFVAEQGAAGRRRAAEAGHARRGRRRGLRRPRRPQGRASASSSRTCRSSATARR